MLITLLRQTKCHRALAAATALLQHSSSTAAALHGCAQPSQLNCTFLGMLQQPHADESWRRSEARQQHTTQTYPMELGASIWQQQQQQAVPGAVGFSMLQQQLMLSNPAVAAVQQQQQQPQQRQQLLQPWPWHLPLPIYSPVCQTPLNRTPNPSNKEQLAVPDPLPAAAPAAEWGVLDGNGEQQQQQQQQQPMLCIKRTYQPHPRRHKRKHGFLKRMATQDGRDIIKRRRMKGRARLSV